MKIILASKSPRRKELLKQIGLEFEVCVSDKEENILTEVPRKLVEQLSKQKAEDVYEMKKEMMNDAYLIIGADTVVALGQNIMGKPKDEEDAKRMLRSLSGKTHSVWTGVTVIYNNDMITKNSFQVETKVTMYPITEEEIEWYIRSKEPFDKAGAYGIQGLGARFIEKIEGDYNNVVGLPISTLYQKIKDVL